MSQRDSILASRWIRPFAHLFSHPSLWHLNRRSVPRAVAIGLFVAFILPVAQIVIAAFVAVALRANVPVSAAATLVTNPLTFGPIYLAAYTVGSLSLRHSTEITGLGSGAALTWGQTLLSVSAPTALGLLIFAGSAALAGYAGAALWWRAHLVRRWRARPHHREPQL